MKFGVCRIEIQNSIDKKSECIHKSTNFEVEQKIRSGCQFEFGLQTQAAEDASFAFITPARYHTSS